MDNLKSHQTSNGEDMYAKAQAALQAEGLRGMLRALTGEDERAELKRKQAEKEQRELEKDWEIANTVLQAKGPAAAVEALAHIRGWNKEAKEGG